MSKEVARQFDLFSGELVDNRTRKLWQGWADEELYEVLAYESCLELKDKHGRHAHFSKREMEWGIENGFTRDHELWETEIRHRTRQMTVQLVCFSQIPATKKSLGHGRAASQTLHFR